MSKKNISDELKKQFSLKDNTCKKTAANDYFKPLTTTTTIVEKNHTEKVKKSFTSTNFIVKIQN